MRNTLSVLTSSLLFAAVTAVAADKADTLKLIHQANQAEIKVGTLAKSKGQSQAVKDYGDKLVNDHSSADKKVADLAKAERVDLSVDSAAVREQKGKDEVTYNKLSKLDGAAFDTAFGKAMNDGHRDVIALLEKSQRDLKGTKTAELIKDTLPTLHQHEDIAAKIEKKAE